MTDFTNSAPGSRGLRLPTGGDIYLSPPTSSDDADAEYGEIIEPRTLTVLTRERAVGARYRGTFDTIDEMERELG